MWLSLAFSFGELWSAAVGRLFYFSFFSLIITGIVLKIKYRKISFILFTIPAFFIIGSVIYHVKAAPDELELRLMEQDEVLYEGSLMIKDVSEKSNVYYFKTHSPILISVPKKNITNKVYPGDIVGVKGRIKLFKEAGNPGSFDMREYYRSLDIRYCLYAEDFYIEKQSANTLTIFFTNAREKLIDICDDNLDPETSGILKAIILGEKSGISEEDINLFRRLGIGHILVVSGLHISLAGMLMYKLLTKITIHRYISLIIAGAFVLMFCMLTGMGLSAIRGMIMFMFGAVGKLIGRTYDMPTASSCTLLIMLLVNPMLITNVSMILSFGCVFSIAYVLPCFMKAFSGRKAAGLVPGAAIGIVSCILGAYYYYRIPILGFAMNLLILPVIPFINILGISGMLLGLLNFYSSLMLFPAELFIRIIVVAGKIFDMIPFNVLLCGHISAIKLILCFCILGISCILLYKRKRILGLIILSAIIIVLIPNQRNGIAVTFLDVGQGDCTIITEGNKCIMIDGGSSDEDNISKYIIEPYMNYIGEDRIDIMVMSHADKDHISGLISLLERQNINQIEIGEIWITKDFVNNLNDDHIFEMCNDKINIRYINKGDRYTVGNMNIECLWPGSISEDDNDNSIVLSLNYKEFDVLFAGDISSKIENDIGISHSYEILKVPHHGSKNSSGEAFLQKIKPKTAIISYGKYNRYGHPSKETIDRLKISGAEIYKTGGEGCINVISDGYTFYFE